MKGLAKMAAIFVRTLIIFVLVGFFLRLMGKRQIGELEISELISTFLISEIAALPIADPDIPLLNGIIPSLLILVLEVIISAFKNKSEKLKSIIDGEPVYLIYKGKLFQDKLTKNRLSVNELLAAARSSGIGDFSKIYHAILEQNGQISVFKKDDDFSIPLIIDGEISEYNLEISSLDRSCLSEILEKRGLSIDKVFLLTASAKNKIKIVRKES